MSEVRNVKDWICLATKQGHTLCPRLPFFLNTNCIRERRTDPHSLHFCSKKQGETKTHESFHPLKAWQSFHSTKNVLQVTNPLWSTWMCCCRRGQNQPKNNQIFKFRPQQEIKAQATSDINILLIMWCNKYNS